MSLGVELININKSFGDRTVLDEVSIKINPGESFVILGSSGTGK